MAFKFYAIKLSGIIFVIFVLQIMFAGLTEIFLLNQMAWLQPWRFITSIFLHGGLGHLLYNLFALALFGSILEKLIGENKFLIVFFITGILANFVSVNFYSAALGASGAIFGIIGALIIIKPLQVVPAFGLPMPIFIAGILWALGDIVGIFVPDGIANIAHLSGMLFGLFLGAAFRPKRKQKKKYKISESILRRWEEKWM